MRDQVSYVRTEALNVFTTFLKQLVKTDLHQSVENQLLAHVNCALNDPNPDVQKSSLEFLTITVTYLKTGSKLIEVVTNGLKACNCSMIKGTSVAAVFIEKCGKMVRSEE